MSFEIRKAVHVLLGISGTVAVVCHTRVCAAVAGAALAIYGADALYALCYRALRVEDAVFERLGASVQVSFQKPEWWHDSVEGYVYVLIPWLSRTQWHPFSAYGAAAGKKRVSLCITAAGDWTRALHDAIERPTTRPIWRLESCVRTGASCTAETSSASSGTSAPSVGKSMPPSPSNDSIGS